MLTFNSYNIKWLTADLSDACRLAKAVLSVRSSIQIFVWPVFRLWPHHFVKRFFCRDIVLKHRKKTLYQQLAHLDTVHRTSFKKQRRHLCSATGDQLVVPSYRLNSCGLWAFTVLCPRLWNSLSRLLHDTSHNTNSFGHSLKTLFSVSTSAQSTLWALTIMHYINLHFTYLLSDQFYNHIHTKKLIT